MTAPDLFGGEKPIEAPLLEHKLRDLLVKHRYDSLSRPGTQRKLMPHHIDALVKDLLPFIDSETQVAWEAGVDAAGGID